MLALSGPARCDVGIVVVANRTSPVVSITREEAAELFLGKRRTVGNNVPLVPLDSDDGALRDGFYRSVAGMSSMRVKAYWSRVVFSGHGHPPPELSLSEAQARIATDADAVTYLRAQRLTPAMKVLLELTETQP